MADQTIGRYRIITELGRGGMGVVYHAVDPVIDRAVALKTIRNSEGLSQRVYAELTERFLREARAAGRLSHPDIVAVLDAGTDEKTGVSFIAMEFVKGPDLDSEIRGGRRYTPDEAAEIIAGVAEALDYAHQQGIVHRDVKPANLLRDASGRIKITDFGIAHLAESGLTRTGQVLGSPAYMSPEQIMGHPVDGRSDTFSLGVVLYQLLTGERPFLGEGMSTLSYQIVHTEPIPARRINPAVPAHLEAVLARALAKDPGQRYPSAREMAQDLRSGGAGTAAAGAVPATATQVSQRTVDLGTKTPPPRTGTLVGATSAALPTPPPAPAASVKTSALPWLIAAVAVLLLLAGGAWLALHDRSPAPGSAPTTSSRAAAQTAQPVVPSPPLRSTPAPAPAPAPAVAAAPSGEAKLFINFEHHLTSGSVTVQADGADIWSSPLRARKQTRFSVPGLKNGPTLRLAHEDLFHEAEVAEGEHVLAVRVSSPGNEVEDTQRRTMTLRAGRKYVLRIRVSRITRRIELETEP